MDQFVLGKRCVNCEIIEADGRGNAPDEIIILMKAAGLCLMLLWKRMTRCESACISVHSNFSFVLIYSYIVLYANACMYGIIIHISYFQQAPAH